MTGLNISIPLTQLLAIFSVMCLCLLMGRLKLGLMTGYLACLYWGYIGNMQSLIVFFGGNTLGQLAYMGCGLFLSLGGVYWLIQPGR